VRGGRITTTIPIATPPSPSPGTATTTTSPRLVGRGYRVVLP